MKKILVASIVTAALIGIGTGVVVYRYMKGIVILIPTEPVEDNYIEQPNEWQPYMAISPGEEMAYRVTWTEKYGMTKTAYCNVIWRNDKEDQYKLTAPWITGAVHIERSNTNDDLIVKVPLNEVPDTGN